ncbi:MAG: adenylate/guanylate cyclase domain-containing response regulator, partial [Spirochaetaceae bacterium]|nr:adenylate/guanylate cyclase domain-containing response regulator [Spirochaetaceae bacterium]
GTWILASDETVQETKDALFTRRLDRVRVVGINEPIRLREVICLRENAESGMIDMVDRFDKALDLFEQKDFKAARSAFENILSAYPDDEASKVFLNRCVTFITYPPEPGWDGVRNLTEK